MELTGQSSQRTSKTCPPKHVEYLSETVARNAVTLHFFAHPTCPGLVHFPCGDHFHIGHTSRAAREECVGNDTAREWT